MILIYKRAALNSNNKLNYLKSLSPSICRITNPTVSWQESGSRADLTSCLLFLPQRGRESFLAALSSDWLGSEVTLPMPLPNWLACVEDDPDWGEPLSEKVVALLLVSRSVPKRKSWLCGWSKLHIDAKRSKQTVSLKIVLSSSPS